MNRNTANLERHRDEMKWRKNDFKGRAKDAEAGTMATATLVPEGTV